MSDVDRTLCVFAVGDGFDRTLLFTAADITRMAGEIGDTNPLHHDAAYAAASRFGGLIASGGHVTAMMLGPIAHWMNNRARSMGLEFGFRLHHAIAADTQMALRWTIAAVVPKASLGGYLVDLSGVLARLDGQVAVAGTCRAVVFADQPPSAR